MNELDVINEALVLIGVPPLASLADETAQALAASNIYSTVRREALADHPWNFAIRESELPRLSLAASALRSTEYDHAYQLPVDLVRVIGLVDLDRFLISGSQLYTNATTARLVYIEDVAPSAWSPHFVRLVTHELAAAFAITLTEKADRASYYSSLAATLRVRARAIDAQQGSPYIFDMMRIYLRQPYNPLASA